jgi:hypothetical protein
MNYSWVVLAWIDPELEERITKSDFFVVERNPGFLKPLGIPSDRAYRPWVVRPRVEVWQEVARKINRETTGRAIGRTSKLTLQDDENSPTSTYNFNIRFYRPGTLCIEVKLEDSLGNTADEFFHYRDFQIHRSATTVVDSLIGIIGTGHTKGYPENNSYSAKAAMLFPAPVDDQYFPEWKTKNKDQLVGLLINNRHYDKASTELSDKIFEKNKDLDVKYAKSAFSMISKQGVLTAYPDKGKDLQQDLNREHLRRFRFLEYALAIQKFVEKYPQIRVQNRDRADFLLHLCQPFLSERTNFPKTVTGSNTWRILAEEFGLERSVGGLESAFIDEVEAKQKYYIEIPSAEYDAFDYLDKVMAATSKHRSWISRDFGDKKILPWSITTVVAIVAVVVATLNFLK